MPAEPRDGSVKPANQVTRLLGVAMALGLGAAAGLGGYTFVYARGGSYLRDDPRACANCHIIDFIEAENSSGFHAPQEALRVLGESINFARKGQLELRPLAETQKNLTSR